MEIPFVIIFLGLLIIVAHLFNFLFKWIKLPNALLLMMIGIVVGPLLGLVETSHFGKMGPVFTSLTLIIVLFSSGTNLKLGDMGSVIGSSTLFSLFNFLITVGIIAVSAMVFGGLTDWKQSLFLGCIAGGTSSAVVIPMLGQLKLGIKSETTLLLESAFTDVLCLILGLALLSAIQKGNIEPTKIFSAIGFSFLMASLTGLGAGLIWSIVLHRVRKLRNSNFLNLAMAFVVSGAVDALGWNSGIAALTFGITLGSAHLLQRTWVGKVIPAQELDISEKNFFDEIAFVLQTYFFVYIGIAIKFSNITSMAAAVIITVAILALRPYVVRLFAKKEMTMKDLSSMAVMMPKGLVPAILASLPLQRGMTGGEEIQNLGFAIVLASILLCSLLIMINPSKLFFLKGILYKKSKEYRDEVALREQQVNPSNETPVGEQHEVRNGEP